MEELVWRKAGAERCERTEKKALAVLAQPVLAQPVLAQPVLAGPTQTLAQPVQAFALDGLHKLQNKREEANHKLNERYLVGQAKQNPFMPNSNFINDIEVQMNFLTPQKSIWLM